MRYTKATQSNNLIWLMIIPLIMIILLSSVSSTTENLRHFWKFNESNSGIAYDNINASTNISDLTPNAFKYSLLGFNYYETNGRNISNNNTLDNLGSWNVISISFLAKKPSDFLGSYSGNELISSYFGSGAILSGDMIIRTYTNSSNDYISMATSTSGDRYVGTIDNNWNLYIIEINQNTENITLILNNQTIYSGIQPAFILSTPLKIFRNRAGTISSNNTQIRNLRIYNSTINNTNKLLLYQEQISANTFNAFNITYINDTFETQTDNNSLTIYYNPEFYTSITPTLYYNNITYTGSFIQRINNYSLYTATPTVPIINSTTLNISFFWSIVFTNYIGENEYYNTTSFNISINKITLALCNTTVSIKALNLSFIDEKNNTYINASINSNFRYWLGSGTIYKNYSYQNNSYLINYLFCISHNKTFYTDADMTFTANSYADNEYHLKNSSLTNVTQLLNVYMLPSGIAQKFYITIRNGVTLLNNGFITISKYFTSTNSYLTTGIRITDDTGKIPYYMEIDGKYRFSVAYGNTLLGIVDKTATCASAPCTININLLTEQNDLFGSYNEYYAGNTISNLSYNANTQVISYNFYDITGTAHYFRLLVYRVSANITQPTPVCDTFSYSTSGSITCNMTNIDGDFIAKGFISRSPEKLDQFISIVKNEILRNGGLMIIFINLAIFITFLFGSAVVSKGNPSTILFTLSAVILLLKLASLFPFGWTIVVSLEVLLIYLLTKVKT